MLVHGSNGSYKKTLFADPIDGMLIIAISIVVRVEKGVAGRGGAGL